MRRGQTSHRVDCADQSYQAAAPCVAAPSIDTIASPHGVWRWHKMRSHPAVAPCGKAAANTCAKRARAFCIVERRGAAGGECVTAAPLFALRLRRSLMWEQAGREGGVIDDARGP